MTKLSPAEEALHGGPLRTSAAKPAGRPIHEIMEEIAAHQAAIHGLCCELLGDPCKGVGSPVSSSTWPGYGQPATTDGKLK